MFVAWSPILSKYLAIKNNGTRASIASGFSLISSKMADKIFAYDESIIISDFQISNASCALP